MPGGTATTACGPCGPAANRTLLARAAVIAASNARVSLPVPGPTRRTSARSSRPASCAARSRPGRLLSADGDRGRGRRADPIGVASCVDVVVDVGDRDPIATATTPTSAAHANE